MRGIALYYKSLGNLTLARQASEIREGMIEERRKSFPLRDFRGVDPGDIERLESAGIRNVQQMLEAGSTPEARLQLALEAGLSPDAVLDLVKLSDLARIDGLKGIRARLYYDAGADTLERIAEWEPEDLRRMLAEFVERTGFEGIAPLPKEVRSTVETARKLEKILII